MNLLKLLLEVQKYPYLYDRSHADFGNKELCNKTWDLIAGVMLEGQWDNLTYAEKAKKVRNIQSKLTPADLADLAERHGSGPSGLNQSFAEPGPSNNQDDDDMEVNVTGDTRKAVVDKDQELLLYFLLPMYKRLSESEKRKVLPEFSEVIEKRLADSTKDKKGEAP